MSLELTWERKVKLVGRVPLSVFESVYESKPKIVLESILGGLNESILRGILESRLEDVLGNVLGGILRSI